MKEPKICLLVDDDPDDQEVFLTALSDVSSTALCLVAPDGDRALELLHHEETIPDYIFLDLNMPRMNGFEFLVVDDHRLLRDGLAALLGQADDLEIVGSAPSGEEAISMFPSLKPDVILMDIMMGGMTGIEATRWLKEQDANVKVILISSEGKKAPD